MITSFVGKLLADAMMDILIMCWFLSAATFASALTLPKGKLRNGFMIFARWGFVMVLIGYFLSPFFTTEAFFPPPWDILNQLLGMSGGLAFFCQTTETTNESQ